MNTTKFAYASFGALCLMGSMLIGLYIGTQTAQAEPGRQIAAYRIVKDGPNIIHFVISQNGDVYYRDDTMWRHPDPRFIGNFWRMTREMLAPEF